ncbi:MAG: hypothetical protein ACSNEK_04235 [Parachlamydiaceae bacterium]
MRDANNKKISFSEKEYVFFKEMMRLIFFKQEIDLSQKLPLYLILAEKYGLPSFVKEEFANWICGHLDLISWNKNEEISAFYEMIESFFDSEVQRRITDRLFKMVGRDQFKSLKMLKRWLPKVKHVDFPNNIPQSKIQPTLQLCTNAEILNIHIHDQKIFDWVRQLPKLKQLNVVIEMWQIFQQDFQCLPIASITGLTKDEQLAYLQGLPLTSLSCRLITDRGLAYLQDLSLKSLVIFSEKVTDQGLFYLAKQPLDSLTIGSHQITDQGLAHLKDLSLRSLEIFSEKVTDQGLFHLKNLPLEFLVIFSEKVTVQGLASLASLPLKSLAIRSHPATDQGLICLKHLLPFKTTLYNKNYGCWFTVLKKYPNSDDV